MQRFIEILKILNEKGFPIPLLRDPKSSQGSITYTMLWISFNLVLFGLIGKWSKFFNIDLTNAITFFGINSGLYFGRQISSPNNNNKKEEG